MRFFDKRDAEDAVNEMDREKIDGMTIDVTMARYPRAGPGRGRVSCDSSPDVRMACWSCM